MIYENHFSLNQRPFTIAPNPDFLYDCGQYQEALAALQYGMLHRGGFVLLTGEVGTGKTTLCKSLLSNIPANTEVALILHPQLDRLEMLQLISREFGIEFSGLEKELQLIEKLTEFLLSVYSSGGHSVLIVDEAQHLDTQVLELIRLLTNLETNTDKLLQIILLGQPELKARLQQYNLRQLNQRFTARYHLKPLSFIQMNSYVAHRIKVAGGNKQIFTWAGLLMLFMLSKGIPRLANLIADRSLMGGYASGQNSIGPWIVRQAAKEVLPEPQARKWFSLKTALPFIMLFMLVFSFARNDFSLDSIVDKFTAPLGSQFSGCNTSSSCWQGLIPVDLLKMQRQGDSALNDIAINKSGSWKKITPDDLANVRAGNKLFNVRIIRNNPLSSGALKLGDSHSSIPWIRSVLNDWDAEDILDTEEDVSSWQVIKPSGSKVVSYLQDETVYDQALQQQIKRFQKSFNLVIDGVIGSQTMVGLELLNDSMGGL